MDKSDNARRERGKNFTEKEKEFAITVIDRYRGIVENKATDGSSQKERVAAWLRIVEEYNATAVSAPRTVKQLKVLWSNLQRIAKKTVAETNKRNYLARQDESDLDLEVLKRKKLDDKKNISKTGGGRFELQLSETEARVLAMVETEARPIPNVYDDNNVYHGDLILSPTRGALASTPLPSPTDSYLLDLEPIAGPSHAHTSPSPELSIEDPESPAPLPAYPAILLPSPTERQIHRKKYIPPKQRQRTKKKYKKDNNAVKKKPIYETNSVIQHGN